MNGADHMIFPFSKRVAMTVENPATASIHGAKRPHNKGEQITPMRKEEAEIRPILLESHCKA
jgi:hypothetical protein